MSGEQRKKNLKIFTIKLSLFLSYVIKYLMNYAFLFVSILYTFHIPHYTNNTLIEKAENMQISK